jgi:hypothetical protein
VVENLVETETAVDTFSRPRKRPFEQVERYDHSRTVRNRTAKSSFGVKMYVDVKAEIDSHRTIDEETTIFFAPTPSGSVILTRQTTNPSAFFNNVHRRLQIILPPTDPILDYIPSIHVPNCGLRPDRDTLSTNSPPFSNMESNILGLRRWPLAGFLP